MKNDLETILTKASTAETLSEERRAHMRAVLEKYTAIHPLHNDTAYNTFSTLLSDLLVNIVRRPLAVSALALVLLIASTGSLAYASEGALPGDRLYDVKVGVLEPLRGALTFTPSAQADWQMTLATRRIDEAATLASRGTLSSTTQVQLSNDFSQNLQKAHGFLSKDGARAENESDADAFMSARLSAYAMVFAQIEHDHPSPEATSFREVLASSISELTQNTLTLSANTSSTSAKEANATTTDDTARARSAAQQSLADVTGQLSQERGHLGASSSIAAYAKLNDAADLVQEGEHLYASGDSTAATEAFKEALSATTKLNVLIRAATLLKVDTLGAYAATPSSPDDATQSHAPGKIVLPGKRSSVPHTNDSTAAAPLSTESTTTVSVSQSALLQTHPAPPAAPTATATPQLLGSVPATPTPPVLHVSL